MLVTFVLGSVHAFSVFLVPFEVLLQQPRSEISLIYSFALIALTSAVLIGYRIYSLLSSWLLVLGTCLLAAMGLVLAAKAMNWWMLFAGYSLVFGICNGIGYGYCLQLVGRVMPEIRGFAGLVAPLTAGLIYDLRAGYELAMIIAAIVALTSALCAYFFRLERSA